MPPRTPAALLPINEADNDDAGEAKALTRNLGPETAQVLDVLGEVYLVHPTASFDTDTRSATRKRDRLRTWARTHVLTLRGRKTIGMQKGKEMAMGEGRGRVQDLWQGTALQSQN